MSSFTRHVFFCLRSNVFSCLAVGGLVMLAALTVAGPSLAPYDAFQCVDIAAPFTLTPTASVGAVSIACQGSPSITCVSDACGSSCTVTMTQQICVSVPIRYGVSLTSGEPTITCADNNCVGCGCC